MRGRLLFPVTAVLIVASLVEPSLAHAQRGTRFSTPVLAVSARHSSTVMRSTPARTHGRGIFAPTNGSFTNTLGGVSFFSTNGLGINGINTIATQDIGIEAAIDPATQWRLAFAERVGRSTGGALPGGFFFLDGGGAYLPAESPETDQAPQPQPQPQPQVIAAQRAPAQQVPSIVDQPTPAEPLPDAGQFTLVLHNGMQIEAVAFTHTKDRIVYITRDGSRRTIAIGDLDSDETVRLNQERGTPLQLPL